MSTTPHTVTPDAPLTREVARQLVDFSSTHRVYQFNSWQHFADHALDERYRYEVTDPYEGNGFTSRKVSNDLWSGTRTWKQAVDLTMNGWPEGRDRVNQLADALLDKITSLIKVSQVEWDVVGDTVDIPSWIQNQPDHWQTFRDVVREGTGRRVFRLLYNMAASAAVETDVMIAKGAAITALALALERAGHSIDIELCQSSEYGNTSYEVYVPLKAADQPLEVGRIAYALAHPAVFRRLAFSVREKDAASLHEFKTNLGRGSMMPAEVKHKKKHADILIEKSLLGEPQWTNAPATIAWILQTLKEQGIQIDD
jgi:hypothetical protein